MTILDVKHLVPASAGVETQDQFTVLFAEGILDLVAVAPLLVGPDDRVDVYVPELADPGQGIGDMLLLEGELPVVAQRLPGGAGTGLALMDIGVPKPVRAGARSSSALASA